MTELTAAQLSAQKQLERYKEERKRQEEFKAHIHFTASEEFCSRPGRVFCSKKLNENARGMALPRLKYMASVMCIVDEYRTTGRTDWTNRVYGELERDYDLSKGEDVMMLASYYPYAMSNLFLMAMELIAEGCYEEHPVLNVRPE
jgi:hypothetical protein